MPEAESSEQSEVKRREGRQLSWAPKEMGSKTIAPSGKPGRSSGLLHALVSGLTQVGKATISPNCPHHPVTNNSLSPAQSNHILSAWHSQGQCRFSRAAVPNLSGTRDQFRGRQFFHGGSGEWFGDDSSALHLLCTFISVLITSAPALIIRR